MYQIKTLTVHWYSFIYHSLWTVKVHVLYINVHITIVWVGEMVENKDPTQSVY